MLNKKTLENRIIIKIVNKLSRNCKYICNAVTYTHTFIAQKVFAHAKSKIFAVKLITLIYGRTISTN